MTPAIRQAAWACSLASRAVFSMASAFCHARRSDSSSPMRCAAAFLRRRQWASVSDKV